MKRFLACLSTLFLAFILVGCSGAGTARDQGADAAPRQEQAEDSAERTGSEDGQDTSDLVDDEDQPSVDTESYAGGEDGTVDNFPATSDVPDEDGSYTSKDEVAAYLHAYGHLPDNYVTKDEAEDAGWKTEGLDLSEACPGKSIGGDRFGNREGLLPQAKGRRYFECDIDYPGHGSRGPKRLVYSNDGRIYYTEDHYQSFERLY